MKIYSILQIQYSCCQIKIYLSIAPLTRCFRCQSSSSLANLAPPALHYASTLSWLTISAASLRLRQPVSRLLLIPFVAYSPYSYHPASSFSSSLHVLAFFLVLHTAVHTYTCTTAGRGRGRRIAPVWYLTCTCIKLYTKTLMIHTQLLTVFGQAQL